MTDKIRFMLEIEDVPTDSDRGGRAADVSELADWLHHVAMAVEHGGMMGLVYNDDGYGVGSWRLMDGTDDTEIVGSKGHEK